MTLAILILGLVTLERLAELPWAAANTRRLLAKGGHEAAGDHYPAIVALHAAWLACLWWLAPSQTVSLPLLGLFALVEIGRVWTLASLGRRWTTRIIVVPGETLVTRGPYRFVSHPNYWVVAAEIALLPLVFGLVEIAVAFSLLNAIVLAVRIRAEAKALESVRQ